MPRRLAALLCLALLGGCTTEEAGRNAVPPAPVHVAPVERGNISRDIDAVGNVRASASVAITPRVRGEIVAVNFTEGNEVQAGESILEIDPRPYAAILAERRANLAKAQAQLQKARRDRSRFGKLAQEGYISRESYDQTVTDETMLAATVAADEAALRQAELDLSFCSITAPISGRIGELKQHKGNMVKESDSAPVCTIDTISPCYVTFSLPEAHLPALLALMREKGLKVTATPIGGKPETGSLTLVDNNVDVKTGAIRLRATFENNAKNLWPGQFVEIRLPLGAIEDTLIVPTRAIQTGRDGAFVYVIGPENKASYRKVAILLERGDKSAVKADLKAGDMVVTEGQVRLGPGAPVQIVGQ